ncbi:hypothetical protein [Pseudonocardia lacus]|uniref:hypothetical protein n=1 Tax=Pseudonocardia lacus TaxID=2835865 RepID=UPI001BDCA84E|nr:hypothetical protein [Pseudonocardia lacus]
MTSRSTSTGQPAHVGQQSADAEAGAGDWQLRKLQHRVDVLDRLYTHLRRCNICDSSPAAAGGEPHICKPMSPGAIRRLNAIL